MPPQLKLHQLNRLPFESLAPKLSRRNPCFQRFLEWASSHEIRQVLQSAVQELKGYSLLISLDECCRDHFLNVAPAMFGCWPTLNFVHRRVASALQVRGLVLVGKIQRSRQAVANLWEFDGIHKERRIFVLHKYKYIYIYIFQTLLCAQYLFNLFYFRPQKNREDVKGFENGVYLKFIG